MTRAGAHQSEKASRPFSSLMEEPGPHEKGASSSMQNFHGKGGFLSNNPLQSQVDNTKAGSPAPVNHPRLCFQLQDFHSRPNQVDFQVGLQEKSTLQSGQASGGASLDPTEEKFLFGDDEDSNWGALLKGDSDHGNSLDNDNFGGALPSLQSGSWSALMQETLQSTTSNNSPKEEWSGLSFQKTELTSVNNSNLPPRDQNKFAALSGTNMQNARPSSASSYADGAVHNPDFTRFQHAARSPYEQRDTTPHESPPATVTNHESTAEVNNGYFQQSLKQKQSDEYGRQEKLHLSNRRQCTIGLGGIAEAARRRHTLVQHTGSGDKTMEAYAATPTRPSEPSSASPSPSSMRLWRPAAQRNLRNQWKRLLTAKGRWLAAAADGRSHASALVNAHLSHRYMPAMDMGVLNDMPGVRDRASAKLARREDQCSYMFLSAYKEMVLAVSDLVKASHAMRCFTRVSANNLLVHFIDYQDNSNDSGDGGGAPIFKWFSMSEFENIAQELVQMFVSELYLKRLLVLELMRVKESTEEHHISLEWMDEIYDGEFYEFQSVGLQSGESCPLPVNWSAASLHAWRPGHSPSHEVLQVYLTSWLGNVNINMSRIDEIFELVGEEMQIKLC